VRFAAASPAELTFHAEGERDVDDSELVRALRAFQNAVFRHPIAIQSLYTALVREGREYAKTQEGSELLERLASSPGLAKTRMAWEVITLSAFVEKPEGALPSVFLDKLVREIKVSALEPVLSRLFERKRGRP
jgi:hypothetical protein